MGNYRSKCSLEKKDNGDNLTDYDLTIYNQKREKVFWGTIAICIIYALIGFIIFISSYFSEKAKAILLNRFLPFTIVFIIGTILIVFFLAYQVNDFKPIRIDKSATYDDLSCPDYWKLQKIPITEKEKIFDSNVNPLLFQYRCVMDPNIFNKGNIAKTNQTTMKITNAGSSSDGPILTTDPNNYNNGRQYLLYVPSSNATSNLIDFSNKNNYPLDNLIHNNMIMNNFTQTKFTNENNSNITHLYRYNIDTQGLNPSSNLTDLQNLLNLDPLKYDIGGNSRYEVKTNPSIKYNMSLDNNTGKLNHNLYYGSGSDPSSASTPLPYVPIVCDSVYPLYLSTKDKELRKANPNLDENLNRCAFAKACNVSWSDLNCDKYEY